MITGIVELNPQHPTHRISFASSISCMFAPEYSCEDDVYRVNNDVWRDTIFPVGSSFLPCKLRRFKLLEYDRNNIYEHMAVAHPTKPGIYSILWVMVVDKVTLRTSKYINPNGLWEVYSWIDGSGIPVHINALTDIMASPKVPSEDVPLYSEWIASLASGLVPLDKEDEFVRDMYKVSMNLASLDDDEREVRPNRVFRDIKKEGKIPSNIPTIGLIATAGKFTPNDLKKVMHPMGLRNDLSYMLQSCNLHDKCVSGLTEEGLWFDVLKYVEAIPYGEFFVGEKHADGDTITVYNPYDRPSKFELTINEKNPEITNTIHKLDELLYHLTCQGRWTLFRSWNEDVYITITSTTFSRALGNRCMTKKFYFDMTYATIGSRMISDSL